MHHIHPDCCVTARRHAPAPESACGTRRAAPALALLAALLASGAGAQALPRGAQVVAGQAHIHVNGPRMTITQTTPKAIVHWQGFDIARGNQVQFHQPDASAIALNRVVAGNASRIDGQLGANGQVWLVNPNGVVFGNGSQVHVGGLVASTLDITNADFGAGRQVFTRGAAQGGILNQGEITVADGATLALLAPAVRNEGLLRARLGNVVLAGTDRVTLQAGADGRLQVAVDPATVRTLIENRHLIMADGGQVMMTASAADALSASVVSNAGTIQARTLQNQGGRILLWSDMQHGQVAHSGLLDASASDAGAGGLVDTFGARVRIEAGAKITTAAAPGKATGHWRSIGMTDLAIHAGQAPEAVSAIAADALTASLAESHVELRTRAPRGQRRSIHVAADIRHDRHHLTLNADHDIHINARISVEGTGRLALNHGATYGDPALPAAGGDLHVMPGQGQVDFAQGGAGFLGINGHGYTVIHDVAALQAMGDAHRLGGRYALGSSIDAGGVDFRPIGADASQSFKGSFDGLGHTIHDLNIDRQGHGHAGLFGHATNAVLRNVKLERANVQGNTYVGALVGHNLAVDGAASIANVQVSAKVSGESRVGGLVGQSIAINGGAASIFNAHSSGRVWGESVVGGLVGAHMAIGRGSSQARIDHSSSASGVGSKGAYVGGLVGVNEARAAECLASISHASATGPVLGDRNVGGLLGYSMAFGGTSQVSTAWAAGQVSGGKSSGGLIGATHLFQGRSVLSNAHASGQVSGDI